MQIVSKTWFDISNGKSCFWGKWEKYFKMSSAEKKQKKKKQKKKKTTKKLKKKN